MNLDGIIEDYPNVETPLDKATFTNLANAILDKICPVGKIEIFYDNDDHSNHLGFTWERTAVGRTPAGIDETQTEFNTIGKTGGSKKHSLTAEENGPHTHPVRGSYPSTSGSGFIETTAYGGSKTPVNNYMTTDSSGSGQPFYILQPYEVFAIWKRVA